MTGHATTTRVQAPKRIVRWWRAHVETDFMGYVVRDLPTVQYHRAHSYHGRTRCIGRFRLFIGRRNDEPAQEEGARLRDGRDWH